MTGARLSPRARDDLRKAADWLSSENLAVSRAFVISVRNAGERLLEQPGLGRQRAELAPEPYRFWPLRGFPYLLVYNAAVVPSRIVRVLHMARDLPAELSNLEH